VSLVRSALKVIVPDMHRVYMRYPASVPLPRGGFREAVDSSGHRSVRSLVRMACFCARLIRSMGSFWMWASIARFLSLL